MLTGVPGLKVINNAIPMYAEFDSYRMSPGDIIMGLNLAVITYRKKFGRIPNSREHPMMFMVGQYDAIFMIISKKDYNKICEFVYFEYLLSPRTLTYYTPFYIELLEDGVHARLIPEPTGREIRICPNCKRKFMQGTAEEFVYRIGANHFCSEACRDEYIENMVPGLGLDIYKLRRDEKCYK
jgi:hypothetical protein